MSKFMGKIIMPKNYVASTHANDFRSLCQPLLSSTDIAACSYVRLYQDGGYFHLTSNSAIDEFMFVKSKGKFLFDVKLLDVLFVKEKLSGNKGNKMCLFTEDINDIGYWTKIYEEFNVKSSLNIIEKRNGYYELFWFITRFGKSMYSFYINHYDVLENFTLYFREKGADLLLIGEKSRFIFTNSNPEYCKMVQYLTEAIGKEDKHIADLKANFKLKRYPINGNYAKTYVTSRELECLYYLGQGFSCKEVSSILQIGSRTVETHLKHMKDKLGVYSNSQLLKIYHSSSLANL
jgi:DNA-binding CsgD family transcriptional regulator